MTCYRKVSVRHATAIALLTATQCFSVLRVSRADTVSTSPPDLAEITVIAPRPATASEIAGDNVAIFVDTHSKPNTSSTGTLSRWKDGVCVKTEGLPVAYNNFVSARVEAVALAAHTPQEKRDPCTPNVFVIFTNEPQEFVDKLVERNPDILGYHYSAQLKNLKTINRPVQAWHITGLKTDLSGVVVDSVWSGPLFVRSDSRVNTNVSSFILFTLVVVDGRKIVGHPLGALSDYVAMIALSQVRLIDSCGELPSILDLMATTCTREKSEAITAADLAYLRSLNSVGQEVDYAIQKQEITKKMKELLTRP